MKTITADRVPILIWGGSADEQTVVQTRRCLQPAVRRATRRAAGRRAPEPLAAARTTSVKARDTHSAILYAEDR